MTDHHDPLDDLASAHLDGALSAAEATRLDDDPELATRVARLEAARRAVAATAGDPIDAGRREQAIGAALAAFDAAGEQVAADEVPPPVDIAEVARRRNPRRALRLAGVAAALALVALTVPLLDRLDPGSNEDLAGSDATKEALETTGGAVADDAAPAMAGGSGSVAELSAPVAPDLGDFADLAGLRDVVRAELRSGSEGFAARDGQSGDGTCAAELSAGDPARYAALASLDGRPVVVVVRTTSADELSLELLDRTTCALVASSAL